jgi:hypothetical protein
VVARRAGREAVLPVQAATSLVEADLAGAWAVKGALGPVKGARGLGRVPPGGDRLREEFQPFRQLPH